MVYCCNCLVVVIVMFGDSSMVLIGILVDEVNISGYMIMGFFNYGLVDLW